MLINYRRKVLITCLVSLVFLIPGMIALFLLNIQEESETVPNKIVEVIKAEKQTLTQTMRLLGVVRPKHASVLTAHDGGTLEVFALPGQVVKKGELIAQIKNAEFEKHLHLTRRAEELAHGQYERLRKLKTKGFISAKELEEKEQLWIQAQKDVEKARMESNHLHFYAPFDGVVGAFKNRSGSQIRAGDDIVKIYDPHHLMLDLDVPCNALSSLQDTPSIVIFNKRYKLNNIQRMMDEETHMCPAEVDIDCSHCLIGSTVYAKLIVAEKKHALVIPFQAIFLRESKPFVYVVEEGRVIQKEVTLGLRDKNRIEIIAGLDFNQQVVAKGQDRLYPGTTVEVSHENASTTNLARL